MSPVTRSATRAASFGGALLAAAWIAPRGAAPFDAIAAIATTVASTAALVAVARIAPLGGLLAAAPRSERLFAAGAVAIVGAFAAVVPISQAFFPSGPLSLPDAVETSSAGAAAFFLLVTIIATWHLRRVRRLDLGASERLSAALTFCLGGAHRGRSDVARANRAGVARSVGSSVARRFHYDCRMFGA